MLRFYQFDPNLLNIDVVGLILCEALTRLPDAHFKICLHLLSETAQVTLFFLKLILSKPFMQQTEPVASLILLDKHLEGARFQLFWPATESVKDLLLKGKLLHAAADCLTITNLQFPVSLRASALTSFVLCHYHFEESQNPCWRPI